MEANVLISHTDKPIATGLSIAPPPKLASLTYGSDKGEAGWNNNLLAWIDPIKGRLIAANYISSTEWLVEQPKLDGSPQSLLDGGFSAMAMTQNMKIYLLSPLKGEIHEYSTNSTAVFEWVWQTTVDA